MDSTQSLRYWVTRKLLETEENKEVLEPNITKLQVFALKIKALKRFVILWQLITDYVAVTKNLVWQNMHCDIYCPRCEE